ncbi:MAG TPA: thioesterase family protein, partial [Myxococcaceae bacterium]|nr:thioesterase family protein [Myxococcaceae bacterium]
MTVEAKLRVIYGDTDQMGVVYYANYFRYFEFARSEYFRAKGGSYRELEQEGRHLPVIEASCSYKAA